MRIDHTNGRAFVGVVDVGLSPAEFTLTALLFSRRSVPLSKDLIAARIGASHLPVAPGMVDVLVLRARRKFAAAGLAHVVATVAGRGYMAADFGSADELPGEPPGVRGLPTLALA